MVIYIFVTFVLLKHSAISQMQAWIFHSISIWMSTWL